MYPAGIASTTTTTTTTTTTYWIPSTTVFFVSLFIVRCPWMSDGSAI